MRDESLRCVSGPIPFLPTSALVVVALVVAAIAVVAPNSMSGQTPAKPGAGKGAIVVMDRATLNQHFRKLGYKARGQVGREMAESNNYRFRTFPHFSSSFSVGGVTYPYTMLGYPPKSGLSATFRSVIVPLRMRFFFF
jgi:hypothetical protein